MKNIRDLLISLKDLITYQIVDDYCETHIAFTPCGSIDLGTSPIFCWTTMIPQRLQNATTVAEVEHLLCLAAVAVCHEISHLLPRWVRPVP